MVREEVARLVARRLLKHYMRMTCRLDRDSVEGIKAPHRVRVDLSTLHPVTTLMLYGLQLETAFRHDHLVGSLLRKRVKVSEFEEALSWLFLDQVVVPIPSTVYRGLFSDCNPEDNIVFELWALRLSFGVLREAVSSVPTLAIPQNEYVLSYKDMVPALQQLLEGGRDIRLYVLSKFARPEYLDKLLEEFAGDVEVELYIATEVRSKSQQFRKRIEGYENVFIVTTRSHRKLVLAVFRDELSGWNWSVAGYRGSMNLFYPGVDDYMEVVNDLDDLQRLVHGLIRAFLIV